MKHLFRKSAVIVVVAALLLVPAISEAQFGGIVYDPTNYSNALLRYAQLQQHLVQLIKTYQQVWNHYQLALRMSQNLENMPSRSRLPLARVSRWRAVNKSPTHSPAI